MRYVKRLAIPTLIGCLMAGLLLSLHQDLTGFAIGVVCGSFITAYWKTSE